MTTTGTRTAVIIGAGPAGAACAIRLAQTGVDVTLIERSAFPRVKVCGEFVSPAATRILEAFLPPDRLIALGARRVDAFTLSHATRGERTRRFPRAGWALSRATLDEAFAALAHDSGVAIEQPAPVRDVRYDEDAARVMLADGRTLSADVVVHADGSGRFDPSPTKRGAAPGVVGLKCHYRATTHGPVRSNPGVVIRAGRGGYVGLIDVEDGLSTCALVASGDLVREAGGDGDEVVRTLWADDGTLPITSDTREGDWLTCGVARSAYVRPGHARSLRVGNAAAAVDPVGGEGIGLALWSGDRLGASLGASADWNVSALTAIERAFAKDYARRLRLRRPGCRAAAWCVSRADLAGALWPMLGGWSPMWPIWFAATGKPLVT
ncbi:MAG: FAD-dependent oxidoreductase [Planctomycetota bacterium]